MSEWISVKDRLPKPEQEVLVLCKTNPMGYEYRCVAFYVPEKWLREESEYNWDYECCGAYSEEDDDYYINEGWYESIHNWDEYNAVAIESLVTHWMPLPEGPEEEDHG